MIRKLGIGASFALTAAAIAIGCGSNKTTFIGGGGGELSNNGFPASSISQNNLASDGGGFSENNQTASKTNLKCAFNFPHAESDASKTSADNSAMFFFKTIDNSSGKPHLFVAYWNGSSFTPPTEITGADRDESNNATNVSATVLITLNTSGLVNNAGTAQARGRTNSGDWLIMWNANTFTQNQTLVDPSGNAGTGILTADAVGPHNTIYATVFIKTLANQPTAITNLIGNTAATGAANGPATECRYGTQHIGTEITPYRNGASGPGQGVGGLSAGFAQGGSLVKPAEDVVSFGAASDTFVHCAKFTGSNGVGGDVGGLTRGPRLGNINGGLFVMGPNTGGPAVPGSSDYQVGDDTSFIQLFWVQLVTSGANLTRLSTSFAPGAGANATVHLGPQYSLITANFNLNTLSIGGTAAPSGQAVVPFPTTRNTFTDARKAQAQPLTDFVCYNNLVFWNYIDTSLSIANAGQVGLVDADIGNGRSQVLSEIAVLPGANGDATIGNQNDITILGTAGKHQILNVQPTAGAIDTGEEIVQPLGLCSGCAVLGPDEGQQDIVAFVIGRVTTNVTRSGNSSGNVDNSLWAVAFTPSGANAGVLETMTNNPKVFSVGVPEFGATGFLNSALRDGVDDVKFQSSRDGTYGVLAWRQAQAPAGANAAAQANLALVATVYKVFRSTAVSGSATVTTPPTLDQRFPTTAPIVVNTASNVAYSGQTLNNGTTGFTGSPVAAYDFQGHISYKCGFQGDRTKMSILWLYSDGTEDRVWIKLLTIGTGTLVTDNPTITATNETEIDGTAAVPALGVNPGTPGIFKATFRFLPTTFGERIPTWTAGGGARRVGCSSLISGNGGFDSLDSVDAGPNATGGFGDVLLVFSKVVAATNNNWDRQIVGALYNQTTISDRAVLSRNGPESTGQTPGGGFLAGPYGGIPNGFKTTLWQLLPNTSNPSLQTAGRVPDNGTYVYFGGPTDNNSSSAQALYTRHFRARNATQGGTAVTFPNTFFPAASAATTDAAFKNPVRIDNATETADATFINAFHSGRQAVVLFTQNNHLWGTVTSDGESYTNTNGLPSAFLADNNISVNAAQQTIDGTACQKRDSSCDNLHGTILVIVKDDVNLNMRYYVRVLN